MAKDEGTSKAKLPSSRLRAKDPKDRTVRRRARTPKAPTPPHQKDKKGPQTGLTRRLINDEGRRRRDIGGPSTSKEELPQLDLKHQHVPPSSSSFSNVLLISCVGNIFSQLVLEGANGLDIGRFVTFVLAFTLMIGLVVPVGSRVIHRYIPRHGTEGALLRLVPDQLVFAPVVNISLALVLSCLTSRELHMLPEEDVWEATVTGWMIWVPSCLIIILFIPAALQVFAFHLVLLFDAVCWSQCKHVV